MTNRLLIEIGVEELPAIPLLKIVPNIEKSWANILKEYNLVNEFEFVYTPRRLVLKHKAMPLKQDDTVVEFFGPPLAMAVKDGEPTKASLGFAKKCGVDFDQLSENTKNGKTVLYFKQEKEGSKTTSLLNEMINRWLSSMSFGKMMRWGDKKYEFIRPVRWVQVRLGKTSVLVDIFGIKSDTKTFIHRMVSCEQIEVPSIDSYDDILTNGAVILEPKARELKIVSELDELEKKHHIKIERDSSLIAEVVAITENPKALLGNFDKLFLELPPEVIITSMKEHQRYFPVFKDEKITNQFVVISNAFTNDYTQVISGNEKVLKPRLADGLFFYKNDLNNGLNTDGLEKVQFIDGLGTLKDKIIREESIALKLLELYMKKVEAETRKTSTQLKSLMQNCVNLAKADLMSEMVYEFTELQGLMGYYYAKALGKDELIYNSIKEQYMPVGEGATLPSSLFSSIVAMSIKIDTLFGLFSVGKIPTGSKDPFALRRAVNGIVRIVTTYDLSFNIDEIISLLKKNYSSFDTSLLSEFILERINKSLDANPSVISSVMSSGERDINEISKKVSALNKIVSLDTFKEQFSTFKRVANISKDIDLDSISSIDTSLFEEEAEKELHIAYTEAISKDYKNYHTQLEALFALKPKLDTYFTDVMVNSDNESLKINRLNTIGSIYKTFKDIADIKDISV